MSSVFHASLGVETLKFPDRLRKVLRVAGALEVATLGLLTTFLSGTRIESMAPGLRARLRTCITYAHTNAQILLDLFLGKLVGGLCTLRPRRGVHQ